MACYSTLNVRLYVFALPGDGELHCSKRLNFFAKQPCILLLEPPASVPLLCQGSGLIEVNEVLFFSLHQICLSDG